MKKPVAATVVILYAGTYGMVHAAEENCLQCAPTLPKTHPEIEMAPVGTSFTSTHISLVRTGSGWLPAILDNEVDGTHGYVMAPPKRTEISQAVEVLLRLSDE